MSIYVVDASVAAKWFFEEPYTEEALRLRTHPHELRAPDYLWVEMSSIVCQRVRRNQILREDGLEVLSALRRFRIHVFPSSNLLDSAIGIALATATSLYDCLYVALAVSLDAQVVTADRRFYLGLGPGRFADRVLWIGDIL